MLMAHNKKFKNTVTKCKRHALSNIPSGAMALKTCPGKILIAVQPTVILTGINRKVTIAKELFGNDFLTMFQRND